MRALFGILGLVLALAIVGWLAKAQLASTRQAVPALSVPGAAPASAPAATVREQSQQIQQQFKQSVEAAMQQARPVPDGQ
jgi:hypothetical protein